MNKNVLLVVGTIVVMFIIIFVSGLLNEKDTASVADTASDQRQGMSDENTIVEGNVEVSESMSDDAMMKKEETVKGEDEMMKNDEGVTMESESMMKDEEAGMEESAVAPASGSYETYADAKLAMAGSGDVVLFFKASWCPSCRAADTNIKSNLSAIPAGLHILEVDYDNSTEMKKKYGVTYQHTFVQVDKDGNLIKKWSGSATLDAIVAQVS